MESITNPKSLEGGQLDKDTLKLQILCLFQGRDSWNLGMIWRQSKEGPVTILHVEDGFFELPAAKHQDA
jgi:hypothetical protein